MEKKIQIGKRLGKNREWKAVADYRKWKKRVCRRKNNCGKRPGSFEEYGRKVGKKTEKNAQKAFYKKTHERPEKVQPEKTVKNRRRRIR